MNNSKDLTKLIKLLNKAYSSAKKRLLIFDYDGTLVPLYKKAADSKPAPSLLRLLTKLTSDPKNEVVISSGRDKHTLSSWIKVPDITLIAEHGIWHKGKKDSEFIAAEGLEENWIEEVRDLILEYKNLLPQSEIEVKDHSISFHYRLADQRIALKILPELIKKIEEKIDGKNLEILKGKMIVEIKNSLVNKGTSAKILVEKLKPDFILAIGDDTTDEYLFKSLPESSYAIRVGPGQTKAGYTINNHEETLKLISQLSSK